MIRKSWFVVLVIAAVLAIPGTAFAHVEITASDPPGEDDVVLTSVTSENECSGAMTSVQVVFPADPEFTIATPGEVEGWTAQVDKQTGSEAVASVTWTNTGNVAGDGEFQLAVGPIAVDQDPIQFKAIDVCDDGETFRWIGLDEGAEFPAPVLTLDHSGHSEGQPHGHPETTSETSSDDPVVGEKDDDSSSTGIIIGVAAGVLVIGLGTFVIIRRKNAKA